MYTHVTIELKYGMFPQFADVMRQIVDIVTQNCGWELREAIVQVDGRLHTVRHIWKLRDMNHYMEGSAFLQAHPDFPMLLQKFNEVIEEEHIAFAVPAPYVSDA